MVLVATCAATYLIVHSAVSTKPAPAHSHPVARDLPQGEAPKAKFYVVRGGDSLAGIAAKTGMSVSELQALNPKVTDPNALQPGQRLLLRR